MKILTTSFLFVISLNFFFCSTKTIWTIKSLSKYTIDEYAKKPFLLSDPINYINESQRKVIYIRLKDIYSKLNVSVFFFVVNKISFKTESKEEIKNGKEFALKLSEQMLKKSTINPRNLLLIIYSIEEKEIFIHKGEYLQEIITAEEDMNFNDYISFIKKPKDAYQAVDVFLTNFLYNHAKSTTDKILSSIGTFGEIFTIGAVIFVILFYNFRRNNTEEKTNDNYQGKESQSNAKQEDIRDTKKDN